jgi:hypothetical protein
MRGIAFCLTEFIYLSICYREWEHLKGEFWRIRKSASLQAKGNKMQDAALSRHAAEKEKRGVGSAEALPD